MKTRGKFKADLLKFNSIQDVDSLTDERIASLSVVSVYTVYKVKMGKGVTERTAYKISEAMGVELDELFIKEV